MPLPELPQTELAIVELTNAFRKEQKLAQVGPNAALTAAARAFAEYLARTGKFAHEADGREPHQRAEAQGYRYCLVAENLALNLDSRGFETRKLARDVVESWKESPGHRENLAQPGVTEIGVGVARVPDPHPKFVSVQLFGRPESMKVQFSIANLAGTQVRYTLGQKSHALEPRTTVTFTSCDPGQLSFEKAAGTRFAPGNGDRFVVRAGSAGALQVDMERK